MNSLTGTCPVPPSGIGGVKGHPALGGKTKLPYREAPACLSRLNGMAWEASIEVIFSEVDPS